MIIFIFILFLGYIFFNNWLTFVKKCVDKNNINLKSITVHYMSPHNTTVKLVIKISRVISSLFVCRLHWFCWLHWLFDFEV
jgi:hypothetical protein